MRFECLGCPLQWNCDTHRNNVKTYWTLATQTDCLPLKQFLHSAQIIHPLFAQLVDLQAHFKVSDILWSNKEDHFEPPQSLIWNTCKPPLHVNLEVCKFITLARDLTIINSAIMSLPWLILFVLNNWPGLKLEAILYELTLNQFFVTMYFRYVYIY